MVTLRIKTNSFPPKWQLRASDQSTSRRRRINTMTTAATRVAVIGSGISGAVCASNLAKNGISVTIFDSGRGPGGRMSQRREISEDGKELLFDHGAPYFTATNADVLGLIRGWEASGFVAEWKEKFGSFDFITKKIVDNDKEGLCKKYVGVPGMNSICRALTHEPGVESKFGVTVGRLEWLEKEDSWSLIGLDGQNLGEFKGVVTSDKNTISPRFTEVTGRAPPLDLNVVSELAEIKEVPVSPCFALMLAFEKPLSSIPVRGFTLSNSKLLTWAVCDSSKPGRSTTSERWVLRSTVEYAEAIIARAGLKKPSNATLAEIAEELFVEFQRTGLLDTSLPFFKKAHRWKLLYRLEGKTSGRDIAKEAMSSLMFLGQQQGLPLTSLVLPVFTLKSCWYLRQPNQAVIDKSRGSAFPAASIARDEKCLWDGKKRLAICGDFCVSPNVEGAILSGLAAASKFTEIFSCL